MVWLVILAVFLFLVIYLLLIPVTLFIDTESNQYYIQLRGLAKASIMQHDKEILIVKLKVLFLKFYIYPLNYLTPSKQNKRHIKKKATLIKIKRILKILKTFRVKRLFVNIDSGNCILNAKLYPLFALLNYNRENFHVNFEGQNQLVLHLKNRPINIIKSIINP
jgi:hypothetical protein